MSKASQIWMKCAALSEAGLSMAPAKNIGWLATTPTGRPAMRTSDVTTARQFAVGNETVAAVTLLQSFNKERTFLFEIERLELD